MRPSKNSHVLAALRKCLSLRQQDLADLAYCSRSLIQSVELGNTPLSIELAKKISTATGVRIDWLLENDRSKPPCSSYAAAYNREFFVEYRARRHTPVVADLKVGTSLYVTGKCATLHDLFESAADKSEITWLLLSHELDAFLASARARHDLTETTFTKTDGQLLTIPQLLVAEHAMQAAREYLEAEAKVFRRPVPPRRATECGKS